MWRSELRRAAWPMAVVLLAAGCATPVAPPATPDTRHWAGRFAVTWTADPATAREERASGRFTLRDAAGRTELEVFSPFGQTVARAYAVPGNAVLETSDGRRFEAEDAEALTQAALGWRAPVQALPRWFAGSIDDERIDRGWHVRVDARENGLPRRLTLRWPGLAESSDTQRVTIRLVLDPEAAAPPDAAR